MEDDREVELKETEGRQEEPEGQTGKVAEKVKTQQEELEELKDKYLRLYAEFENYKKKVVRDKEELVKYANESLIYELLPSIDHLNIALQHSSGEAMAGLAEGVENTSRELERTLEKFGLKPIEALGMPFDPEYHHAMTQVESEDVAENTVVEEFRKGFLYGDKVLRASLVAVSKRPAKAQEEEEEEDDNEN